MKTAFLIITGLVSLIMFYVTAKYLKHINGNISLLSDEDSVIFAVILITSFVLSCISVLIFNNIPQI